MKALITILVREEATGVSVYGERFQFRSMGDAYKNYLLCATHLGEQGKIVGEQWELPICYDDGECCGCGENTRVINTWGNRVLCPDCVLYAIKRTETDWTINQQVLRWAREQSETWKHREVTLDELENINRINT